MKTQLDLKSVIIGLLAGIVTMLATGATFSTPTIGRFQVGGTASQALVVDTITGQVWTMFTPSGSGSSDNDFAQPKLRSPK